MSEPAPVIRLPIVSMALAGPGGTTAIAGLGSALGVMVGGFDPIAPWWGWLAATTGLTIGFLIFQPWKLGTAQALSMRVFAGQGVSMMAVLFIGLGIWLGVRPEPAPAGLTAAAGFMAGLMLQVQVFARAVRSLGMAADRGMAMTGVRTGESVTDDPSESAR